MTIKIGIIEPNNVFSKTYVDFFEAIPGYTICFQVPTIKELISQSNSFPVTQLLIADFNSVDNEGFDTVKFLKSAFPSARLIIFTSNIDIDFILNCLKGGADSFLLKTEGLFELHRAVKENLQNGLVISPLVTRLLVQHLFFGNEQVLPLNLSHKEKEIIYLLKDGLSYKQMAGKLNVTSFTINHHLKKIYKKGGVNSRSQLMAQLQKFGI